jgi:hypothetical protein
MRMINGVGFDTVSVVSGMEFGGYFVAYIHYFDAEKMENDGS